MGAYKLYTYAKDDNTPELPAGVTSDPNFYDAYPNGANGIDPFKSYSDIFTGEAVASINPELIWEETRRTSTKPSAKVLSLPRWVDGDVSASLRKW